MQHAQFINDSASKFDQHQPTSAGLWANSLPILLPATVLPSKFFKRKKVEEKGKYSGPRTGIANQLAAAISFGR